MLQILRSAACDAAVPAGDGGMVDCIIIRMSSSTTLKDSLLYSFNRIAYFADYCILHMFMI